MIHITADFVKISASECFMYWGEYRKVKVPNELSQLQQRHERWREYMTRTKGVWEGMDK